MKNDLHRYQPPRPLSIAVTNQEQYLMGHKRGWEDATKRIAELEKFTKFQSEVVSNADLEISDKDKRIVELEAQTQWISVEDRLPETFQRVLALTTDYDLDPVHTLVHFNGVRAGFLAVGGRKDKNVTHWMPLPTPPKERGE